MGLALCTIPVYPCSEKVFDEKWDAYLRKQLDEDSDFGKLIPALRKSMEPASVWKLNRIIGYIAAEITRDDIFVEAYKMDRQQFGAIKASKGTIKNLQINGNHFRHVDMSNEEISLALKELVVSTADRFFPNKYADMNDFLTTCRYTDYKSLAEVSPFH